MLGYDYVFKKNNFYERLKMGIGDTLGVIFAALFILVAIGLGVWYFVFRRPNALAVGASCTKDSDCSATTADGQNVTFLEQYQGEVCVSGKCQSVGCKSNSTCNTKLPGSTCFGVGPQSGEGGCVPLNCRTTDDCLPGGGNPATANVVCVPGTNAGQGICVPQSPPDKKGGCYNITGLVNQNGKCVVCGGGAGNCRPGSYCQDGKCLRCGNTGSNLCESRTGTEGPGPWGFCRMGQTSGEPTCPGGYECTRTVVSGNGQTRAIELPDGSSLPNNVGLCLPQNAECAFSWFNTTGTPTGPAPFAGQCPALTPYCSFTSGQCQNTPTADGGAVCGLLPGVPTTGLITSGTRTGYDMRGLCSGRLVTAKPNAAYTNIADWTTQGGNFTNTTCPGANPASNCECDTSDNPSRCPRGTYCQVFTTGQTGATKGFCTIAAGTGTSVSAPDAPLSGVLGHFYVAAECQTNSSGIPVCTNLEPPTSATAPPLSLGGPGDFCYANDQCLFDGKFQGKSMSVIPLTCDTSLNVCIGFNS